MALFQNIVNPDTGKPNNGPALQKKSQAAVQQVKRVHNVTKLSNLTMEPIRRSAGHYDTFLPHPLLRKPTAGVRPLQTPARPQASASKLSLTPTPTTAKESQLRTKIIDFLQYPLIAILAVGAAYSSSFGQILVGIFLIIALIFRLGSRVAFICALILIVSIPFFQILHQDSVSNNSAIYAFEMLCVGTALSLLESWQEGRPKRVRVSAGKKKQH